MRAKGLSGLLGLIAVVVMLSFSVLAYAQQAKTLKIGGTMPLNVGLGVEAKKCWEAYVDYINNSGGVVVKGEKYKLELIIYDDKYTAEGGRAGVERLVHQDNVKNIIAIIPSAATLAALPVIADEKILMISGCATEKVIDPKINRFIRMENIPSVIVARWDFVSRRFPKALTYALMAPDDESGRDSAHQIKGSLSKYGKKLVDEVYFPRATTDFSGVATRIKTANPDFVGFPANSGEADFGNVLKALYEAGYRGIKVGEFYNGDIVRKIATDEQIEGTVVPVMQSDLPEGKRNQASIQFEKIYRAKYGNFVTLGVNWLRPLYGYLAALKKANSVDVDDVYSALGGLEFMNPDGMARVVKRPDAGVNRYCDTVVSYDLGIVRNGKAQYVESMTTSQVLAALEKTFGGGSWK